MEKNLLERLRWAGVHWGGSGIDCEKDFREGGCSREEKEKEEEDEDPVKQNTQ